MTAQAAVRRSDAFVTAQDPRWRAVVARDASADGTFFYSVATTGVYCVPSCAARLANPANVRFHSTREDAERAGFRACKRCRPDGSTRLRIADGGMRFVIGSSSLGLVLVARSDTGITAVLIGDDRGALQRDLQGRFPRIALTDGDAELRAIADGVIGAIESPERTLDVPLDLRGTEFQRRVWQALRQIPAGATTSYGELAAQLGLPKSARAVAHACAANPVAVIIPCHRVLRSDGHLAGYRWGIERKRALLERESRA